MASFHKVSYYNAYAISQQIVEVKGLQDVDCLLARWTGSFTMILKATFAYTVRQFPASIYVCIYTYFKSNKRFSL